MRITICTKQFVSEEKNYTTQIKELETELREAYEKNAELEEKIDELTEIINGAYVLIASKEDLKKKGIYTSNQLSKNRFDHSNLDKKWFKSVDIRSSSIDSNA